MKCEYPVLFRGPAIAAALIAAVSVCGCSSMLPEPRPLPADRDFSGTWDTNWGQLTLVQSGARVYGRYKGFRNGAVSGTADGDLLLFGWTQQESNQTGRGYLQMSRDGGSLEGRWGYLKDRLEGGRWWAKRVLRSTENLAD